MATAVGSYATATEFKRLMSITDTTDDTLIGLICDRINQYIESTTKQPICPINSTSYLYDGDGLSRIFLPAPKNAATLGIGGMRAVTLVEFAPYTAGTFETLTATDYFLEGRHGVNGPYRWLRMSNLPTGSYRATRNGLRNVRITGTAGWSAIPDDVTEMALAIAQRAWNARQDVGNMDSEGLPFIPNYVTGRDKETLKRYTLRWVG